MNNKDVPFHLADKMKASSQRQFEMKNEAEVDETATKWKSQDQQSVHVWNKNLIKTLRTSSYNAVAGPNAR